MVHERLAGCGGGQAASYGVTAELRIDTGYPATVNDPDKVAFAAEVARDVAHGGHVVTNRTKEMGAEDFSFMLNACPGAYLFLGPGRGRRAASPRFRLQRCGGAGGRVVLCADRGTARATGVRPGFIEWNLITLSICRRFGANS